MGASNSRAGGGGGRDGGLVRTVWFNARQQPQKQQRYLRRSGAPRASPRRVAPSDHASGTQNSPLNSENIQRMEDQGRLTVSPVVEQAAPKEQMLASRKDDRKSNEGIVVSQITQAIKALHVASNVAHEPGEGCGFDAPEVDEKPNESDSFLPMMEEEDDDCPICLEVFDEENPKLVTQCEHHYHLCCILEWMERNATCPICCQVVIFDETS